MTRCRTGLVLWVVLFASSHYARAMSAIVDERADVSVGVQEYRALLRRYGVHLESTICDAQ